MMDGRIVVSLSRKPCTLLQGDIRLVQHNVDLIQRLDDFDLYKMHVARRPADSTGFVRHARKQAMPTKSIQISGSVNWCLR